MGMFTAEIVDDAAAQERVRAWIAALRSGTHQQATGALRTGSGFCCLGVACDLYDSSRWALVGSGAMWGHLGHGTDLPDEVANAYRLRTWGGAYGAAGEDSLMVDNDGGMPFPEIALVIERELEVAIASRPREEGSSELGARGQR